MPIYTYRREDGTTFDIRQRFFEDPLDTCPSTGQGVNRVIQPAGIIFKGSGFYVNDNNKANNAASPANGHGEGKASDAAAAKPEAKAEKPQAKRPENKAASEGGKRESAPATK